MTGGYRGIGLWAKTSCQSKAAKEATDLRFVFVGRHFKLWKHNGRCRFCTIGDWLNLFANAKAVITNSFHGTAFSLHFKKPFISVGLPKKIRNRNVRISELLEAVQLSERFVDEDACVENTKYIMSDPDWTNVGNRLSKRITPSVEFLLRSLDARECKKT